MTKINNRTKTLSEECLVYDLTVQILLVKIHRKYLKIAKIIALSKKTNGKFLKLKCKNIISKFGHV